MMATRQFRHTMAAVILLALLAGVISPERVSAQEGNWNGKKAAVSLTYDDALDSHLDIVVPLLNDHGHRATFYVTGVFPGFTPNIERWRAAAADGHELGNHLLFHPCRKTPGRSWVSDDYNLSTYSVERVIDEARMMNLVLDELGASETKTFAYPCGDLTAGDSSYVSALGDLFLAARTVQGQLESVADMDLLQIGSYVMSNHSAEAMAALVDRAIEAEALIVFLFHGVGGDHSLNVTAEDHAGLIRHLDARADEIWVAPLAEIAAFVQRGRSGTR